MKIWDFENIFTLAWRYKAFSWHNYVWYFLLLIFVYCSQQLCWYPCLWVLITAPLSRTHSHWVLHTLAYLEFKSPSFIFSMLMIQTKRFVDGLIIIQCIFLCILIRLYLNKFLQCNPSLCISFTLCSKHS